MVNYKMARGSLALIEQANGSLIVLNKKEKQNLIDLVDKWCEQNNIYLENETGKQTEGLKE